MSRTASTYRQIIAANHELKANPDRGTHCVYLAVKKCLFHESEARRLHQSQEIPVSLSLSPNEI